MKTVDTTTELRWFLVIAFGVSWALWTPALVAALDGRSVSLSWFGNLGSNPIATASLAAIFGPLVAAVVVTWISRGRSELRPLVRGVVQLRFGFRWYLAAILLSPVVDLSAALARQAITGTFDFSHPSVMAAVSAFAIGTAILVPIIVGEELGWRGFALIRLQAKHTALRSSIILGLTWSVWHLPYWVALAYTSTGSMWKSLLTFFSMVPTTVAVTVLMTWVFNGARGSVFAAMLMHAAHNSAASVLTPPDQLESFGDLWAPGAALTWATTSAAFIVAAVAVVFISGVENLSHCPRVISTSQTP